MAAIRKQIASIRPSSRRSFECSARRRSTSAAGWDMPDQTPVATAIFRGIRQVAMPPACYGGAGAANAA